MTNWITWNGGECPIKSDKTRVEYEHKNGRVGCQYGPNIRWSHINSVHDIIAYRIIEDNEPMTREQIKSQIEALQEQLDAMPVVERRWFHNGSIFPFHEPHFKNYFDIETINGVPHIHGVAMKELEK
jgi:hypothetical protein